MGSNRYRFELPQNYLINQQATKDVQFVFRYTTHYPSSGYYNGFIIGGPGVHRFQIQGNDGSTYTDIANFDFVPYAKPFGLTIVNRYKAAGRQTRLEFQFKGDVNLNSGHQIVFTFDSHNLINQMFASDLEG